MKKESHSKLALNAMIRASKKAILRAASLDLEIPVWKDGKVVYVKAKEKARKMGYL